VQPQESLLRQILGFFPIADQPPGQTDDFTGMFLDQQFKTGMVTVANPLQQCLFFRINHALSVAAHRYAVNDCHRG